MTDFILRGEPLERLRREVRLFGKQSELAAKAGIPPSSLSQILAKGGDVSLSRIGKLADALGKPIDYFFGGNTGSAPISSGSFVSGEADSDTVDVVVADVSYGLGGSYVDDVAMDTSVERFPRAFIRQFAKGPVDQLYFAVGVGDSMEPTIHSSDLVLIDRSQRLLRVGDQIWAAAVGEICMVKRIRIGAGGEVLLVSDKPGVSDYSVAQDELQLIGRVVCVVKKL